MSIHKMRKIDVFNGFRIRNFTRTNSVTIPKFRLGFSNASEFSAAESFIEIAVAEVVAFYLYSVLIAAIRASNSTANGTPFTGSTGALVGLVTVFYILAAALLPIGVLKYNLRGRHDGR